jgi:hypothetical protein
LVNDANQPIRVEQLEDSLVDFLRNKRRASGQFLFGFGSHQSLLDLLLQLSAMGALRIQLDDSAPLESRVSLTTHGKHLVEQAPQNLRQSLGFA